MYGADNGPEGYAIQLTGTGVRRRAKTDRPLFAKLESSSTMCSARNESSPVVGSSQNNKAGLESSSHANVSRRASPPEIMSLGDSGDRLRCMM